MNIIDYLAPENILLDLKAQNKAGAIKEIALLLKNKPEDVEMILTGRNAPEELLELADYVTEMRMIKHPFQKGIYARKGIES